MRSDWGLAYTLNKDMELLNKIKNILISVFLWSVKTSKAFGLWVASFFIKRYKVTVSFNNVYGDADDRLFIAKKLIVQKEKHLKFRDDDNKIVEYRSSTGLNYIIEDYDYGEDD